MQKNRLPMIVLMSFVCWIYSWERPVYNVLKVKRITIDGEIEESWRKAKIETIDKIIKKSPDEDSTITWLTPGSHLGHGWFSGPEDISFRWRALWDDENLYLLIEVTDDKVIRSNIKWAWCTQDAIELFFDPFADGTFHHQRYILPFLDGKAVMPRLKIAKCASKRTKDGYLVEVAIPHEFFYQEYLCGVYEGKILGFDIAVDDWESEERYGRETQLVWAGTGDNWINSKYYGRLVFVKEEREVKLKEYINSWANTYGKVVWKPDMLPLYGWLALSMPYVYYKTTEDKEWHFGEVKIGFPHEKLKNVKELPRRIYLGTVTREILFVPDFLYQGVEGYLGKDKIKFEFINTYYYPGKVYETNSARISFFVNMESYEQPGGPTYIYLPLKKQKIKKLKEGKVIYSSKREGDLKAGFVIVFFCCEGRDNDVPILLTFTRRPKKILFKNGITLSFDRIKDNYISLMPLLGVKSIPKEQAKQWLEKGLPKELIEKAYFWYRASLRIPIQQEEYFYIDDNAVVIKNRFVYTKNISEWDYKEILLAPLPPLYGLVRDEIKVDGDLKELLPLPYGPYYAKVNSEEIVYRLELPEIKSVEFPKLDIAKLSSADKEKLNKFNAIFNNAVEKALVGLIERCRKRKIYTALDVTTVASFLSAGLNYIDAETKDKFLKIVEEGFKEHYLNPKAYYKRTIIEGTPIVMFYGSPTWVERCFSNAYILAGIANYSFRTGDWSWYERGWDYIREMLKSRFMEGCNVYAFDEGLAIGEGIIGAREAAKRLDDKEIYNQASLMLAQYAYTIPISFRWIDYAKKYNLKNILNYGEKVQSYGPAGFSPLISPEEGWVPGVCFSPLYDPYFPEVLSLVKEMSYQEVRRIETILVSKHVPDWYTYKGRHLRTVFGRFASRAIILDEEPKLLEKYLNEIEKNAKEGWEICFINSLYFRALAGFHKR